MTDALKIVHELRQVLSKITADHPPELKCLGYAINDALAAPRWRRYERDRLILELANHFPNVRALAAELKRYQTTAWKREQHLPSPPPAEERRLMWLILKYDLDVPESAQGLAKILEGQLLETIQPDLN